MATQQPRHMAQANRRPQFSPCTHPVLRRADQRSDRCRPQPTSRSTHRHRPRPA
jgi:hypothetical protein